MEGRTQRFLAEHSLLASWCWCVPKLRLPHTRASTWWRRTPDHHLPALWCSETHCWPFKLAQIQTLALLILLLTGNHPSYLDKDNHSIMLNLISDARSTVNEQLVDAVLRAGLYITPVDRALISQEQHMGISPLEWPCHNHNLVFVPWVTAVAADCE